MKLNIKYIRSMDRLVGTIHPVILLWFDDNKTPFTNQSREGANSTNKKLWFIVTFTSVHCNVLGCLVPTYLSMIRSTIWSDFLIIWGHSHLLWWDVNWWWVSRDVMTCQEECQSPQMCRSPWLHPLPCPSFTFLTFSFVQILFAHTFQINKTDKMENSRSCVRIEYFIETIIAQ